MDEKIVKFKPTFENGGFWELYKDLERQFEDFLTYVPYLQGNQKAYSFRLLNLILSVGGHIDSAFKEMARFPKFSEDEKCKEILKRASERSGIFSTAVTTFDNIYKISSRKIYFKRLPERELVIPFSRSAKWWHFYGDLKHEISLNLEYASLATLVMP